MSLTRRRGADYRCGRFYGEANPRAKLTWPLVAVLRQGYAAGHTITALAALFSMPRSTVKDVGLFNTWTTPPAHGTPSSATASASRR